MSMADEEWVEAICKNPNGEDKPMTSTCTTDVNGTKTWRNAEGKLHREDGPALEYADGTKHWYRNDKPHREDGPAIVRLDGYKAWWLDGERLTNAEWAILTASARGALYKDTGLTVVQLEDLEARGAELSRDLLKVQHLVMGIEQSHESRLAIQHLIEAEMWVTRSIKIAQHLRSSEFTEK